MGEFSDFIDYFNNPLNQDEALTSITTYRGRIAEEIYTDSAIWNDVRYPYSQITKTDKLALSGTLDSKYEPIGNETNETQFIEPMYEKTVAHFSVDEMEY